VFEQVDVFVAPSAALADEYRRLGLDGRRLRVADYGFRPLERLGRRAHDGPLRLGYVGTLVWHKGVHVLLDAVRQLPAGGWDLKIFGDPTVCSDYVSRLRAQASGLPVRFMGGFDRAGVADVYAGIDVLVVPSLWLENSPLVIHEAFMAGVAVVGARIGGIADLVTEGENGMLYAPSSVDGLATVLRALVTDPSRVDALAARVTPVRSITEDAAGWEAIYEDVVEGNASRKETLV
jgi:glycosyltransferase involved in cell wall biosynthesis